MRVGQGDQPCAVAQVFRLYHHDTVRPQHPSDFRERRPQRQRKSEHLALDLVEVTLRFPRSRETRFQMAGEIGRTGDDEIDAGIPQVRHPGSIP